MTDEEKKQLVDAVITQLKNEGTDVSNANIVTNANGIDYVVAYGKNGEIVRAVPTAISGEKTGASGNMNSYTDAGVYNINTTGGEDLPIDNQGAISARLTVLVTESDGNKVITQVLNLNNNAGGEGNVYIRSCQNGEWKAWGKLQTNVEVGQINTLDHLTDNGIYSGVFTDGTPTSVGTFYDTFVLIVINNYAVSIPTGNPQSISQLKYSLGLDGSISVASRKRDQYGYWDNWTSLDEKSLVADEKTRAEQAENALDDKIAAEADRAKEAENELANAITDAPNLALRQLFVDAGATYNASTGYYELNGITDLTESQMRAIYDEKELIYKLDCPRVAQKNTKIRTFYPLRYLALTSQILKNRKLNGTNSFYAADALEVLRYNSNVGLDMTTRENALPCDKYFGGVFSGCIKLTKVYPLDFTEVTTLANSFANCVKLEELRILKLHHNLNIQDSALISKKSILYIIGNSIPTSAITITLHHDAYVRLTSDTEVVTALSEKNASLAGTNGKISLVCATHSDEIIPNA